MNTKIISSGFHTTITKPISVLGRAPFSGKAVKMTLRPSSAGNISFLYKGIKVLVSSQSIKMQPQAHTTVLCSGDTEIVAVEHLLSALYGLQITSLEIELEGDNQVPALDSSAKFFTDLLKKAKIEKYGSRQVLKIIKQFEFRDKLTDSYAILQPSTGLQVNLKIVFNNLIGSQSFSSRLTRKNYVNEICWGRTFIRSPLNGDITKWQRIRSLIPILPEDPAHSPIIVFSDQGFITKLIKSDEPVRHKMVDFLGDLSLLGMLVEGKITVYKPGHYFNHQLVRFIHEQA